MNRNKGLQWMCVTLIAALLLGLFPADAQAAELVGKFVLTVETGDKLVIAPEYVTYTEGQTIGEALQNSGHTFTGIEQGQVTAIDDVTGNYTRSDQSGGYDLSTPASEVTHYTFSERPSSQSKPSEGKLLLMTAMAEYLEKPEDVRNAAKDAYDTAKKQFVGCSSDDARTLAYDLNNAMCSYEDTINGERYSVRFTDGNLTYSGDNFPGVVITAKNSYGKAWMDDGDGVMELPQGRYSFRVEQHGLSVTGTIVVSAPASVAVQLPTNLWLKLDTFRLSGSYGADNNEEHRFTDGEFPLESWEGRSVTVPVIDLFTGAVYTYAEYDTNLLDKIPTLTAVYTMAGTGKHMEKALAFESKTSGAYEVLGKGASGNTVIYRLTHESSDGYTYSQDYTVTFTRIPTLTSISVTDQNGTDQAPSTAFRGDVREYVYKVLDTAEEVTVRAQGLGEGYEITVNGTPVGDGVKVSVNGVTTVELEVSAQGHTNAYHLTIEPGEGKILSFLSDKTVSIQVVNSNGVVMPFTTHRETSAQNRYKYTLVPGETYHYIATKNTYYHIADDFRLEDVANSTITVDFGTMEDWLESLSLGTAKGSRYKDTILLDGAFSPERHFYQATYPDTEHNVFLWVQAKDKNLEIQALYTQLFSDDIYHGKEYAIDLISGMGTGEKLNRFLLDENPVENILTIRLTREENGVVYYQDYQVELKRELTLKDISADCDGVTATMIRKNGTPGFLPEVRNYEITVSMAAQELQLELSRYMDNLCFGEEEVGYRVYVDGMDVTDTGVAIIPLDGTMNTQIVTVTVENNKAPQGTGTYTLDILKSPPVDATFLLYPDNALLNIYETLSGERIWPGADGSYQLCEGYSYVYALTEYGYVGVSGILEVTRDENTNLIVRNGEEEYLVSESEEGGEVTIVWGLELAPENPSIDPDVPSDWPDFRGNSNNNAVTADPIPTKAEDGTLLWATKMGEGFDADAVGSPILVDGVLITYAGDRIFRVDTVTGEVLTVGYMDHKSSFSITPPTYAEGMVFVALSNGCVQAFHAQTLESLWLYNDPLGGQPNCPLIVENGYLYTGFWNSETGDANFVCLTITDEDPTQPKEEKYASWKQTAKGGYYWAGAYVGNGYVLVGTDDGTNLCNAKSSSLLLLDAKTGALLDRRDQLNGDIRSTIVYDEATDAFYFTAKGGTFYSVQVSDEWRLSNLWSVVLENGMGGIPMSTSSPVVYNGRAYVGVSGTSQFGAYSGHNITVIDLETRAAAYQVQTQGYPQTSGLLTTAYEAESGYVYIYFFDNMTPGKLRVLRDRPGMTVGDYLTTELGHSLAYALFTPTGEHAQYAICSPIVDEYGTVYFKNDSAYLMAYGSAVERIEITSMPEKTVYAEGEIFDSRGMVVTAVYANGRTRDVTRYVTWQKAPLMAQDGMFTISFPHVLYHNREDGTQMLTGVASTTPTAVIPLTISSGTMGDVNHDGTIDSADAQMILDYEAKNLTGSLSSALADVSGDGVIDSNDAVLIEQYIAGKLDSFPARKKDE